MSLVDELPPGAAGLHQLRAMLENRHPVGIGAALQFRLVEVDDGRVVFTGVPGTHAYNPIGTLHVDARSIRSSDPLRAIRPWN